MRISRGLLTKLKLTLPTLLILGGLFLTTQNLLTNPNTAKAATPPDSCFAFDAATGSITNYYDNENNDSANPACPKDVDIPSTIGGVEVEAITGPNTWTGAFQEKQLTTVTIPNSVTAIGNYAFSRNQLATLQLGSSVTTIGDYAFASNQLNTVAIPLSLTEIGPEAFGGQLGGITFEELVALVQSEGAKAALPYFHYTQPYTPD